jgi:hypothetical protein
VGVALLAFGGFVLAHLLVDMAWARLLGHRAAATPSMQLSTGTGQLTDRDNEQGRPARSAGDEVAALSVQDPDDEIEDVTSAFREAAGVFVQTAGVVLGLVAGLATTVTPALKLGAVALAGSLLVTLVLYGYVLHPLPPRPGPQLLIRYLFALAFFALALGLLSVAMSIAFTQ